MLRVAQSTIEGKAYRAFTLVLGTVPAGTCSRNMFSVHTISSSMNDVLKRIVPARTVPAGTWSNHGQTMFSEQKLPVSTPPEQIWTLRYREQCTKWAGLSTQTAISTESAHQNDLTRCAVYTQYVILRSPRIVPVTNLNEAVPRTFHSARNMNACVPRTCSENILPGFCTENIYERAPYVLLHKVGRLNVILNSNPRGFPMLDFGMWG